MLAPIQPDKNTAWCIHYSINIPGCYTGLLVPWPICIRIAAMFDNFEHNFSNFSPIDETIKERPFIQTGLTTSSSQLFLKILFAKVFLFMSAHHELRSRIG